MRKAGIKAFADEIVAEGQGSGRTTDQLTRALRIIQID